MFMQKLKGEQNLNFKINDIVRWVNIPKKFYRIYHINKNCDSNMFKLSYTLTKYCPGNYCQWQILSHKINPLDLKLVLKYDPEIQKTNLNPHFGTFLN